MTASPEEAGWLGTASRQRSPATRLVSLSEMHDMTLGQIVSPIPGHTGHKTVRFWPKDKL